MIDFAVVNLSRVQFAATALYHFLFVPLTLGMTFLLAVMETIYLVTGKEIYKDMTKFWGKLFGINFALGVTTGITMEFQFGMNWSYYSHYVGDIFGAPLAIEALMAFFLESTLVGLFIFGWDKMSKIKHLIVTWGVAFGTNLSALWILVANGWMQSPFGSKFNPDTMRMELANFSEVLLNPVAQVKFLHTVLAGYITGAIFIMAISSYYLLKKKDIGFAKRSFTVASIFGFFAAVMVIFIGDEAGYELHKVQPSKLAAIEAEWHTQKAPASFTAIGFPSFKDRKNSYSIEIPYVLGLIGTRSLDKQIVGINDLIIDNEQRIRNGIYAVDALNKLRKGDKSQIETLNKYQKDLGYGMLLKRYTNDVTEATEEYIKKAAIDSVPNNVASLFFAFRIMVFSGFILLLIFFLSLVFIYKRSFANKTWFLKLVLFSLPLPWIAIECGWWVAEYGRQPWAIHELLPVFLAASNLTVLDVALTLITMTLIYSILAVVEVYLMQKYARIGPSSIHAGDEYYEQNHKEQ